MLTSMATANATVNAKAYRRLAGIFFVAIRSAAASVAVSSSHGPSGVFGAGAAGTSVFAVGVIVSVVLPLLPAPLAMSITGFGEKFDGAHVKSVVAG